MMKSERFACITMLCSFQKTEGNDWERELKNQMILKFDWQCKYFFFSIFY